MKIIKESGHAIEEHPDGTESWHHEPAIGECDCGEEVVLQGFTCTCYKCGADYNSAGQQLAPRHQWGEETGESVSDILSIDNTPTDQLLEGY